MTEVENTAQARLSEEHDKNEPISDRSKAEPVENAPDSAGTQSRLKHDQVGDQTIESRGDIDKLTDTIAASRQGQNEHTETTRDAVPYSNVSLAERAAPAVGDGQHVTPDTHASDIETTIQHSKAALDDIDTNQSSSSIPAEDMAPEASSSEETSQAIHDGSQTVRSGPKSTLHQDGSNQNRSSGQEDNAVDPAEAERALDSAPDATLVAGPAFGDDNPFEAAEHVVNDENAKDSDGDSLYVASPKKPRRTREEIEQAPLSGTLSAPTISVPVDPFDDDGAARKSQESLHYVPTLPPWHPNSPSTEDAEEGPFQPVSRQDASPTHQTQTVTSEADKQNHGKAKQSRAEKALSRIQSMNKDLPPPPSEVTAAKKIKSKAGPPPAAPATLPLEFYSAQPPRPSFTGRTSCDQQYALYRAQLNSLGHKSAPSAPRRDIYPYSDYMRDAYRTRAQVQAGQAVTTAAAQERSKKPSGVRALFGRRKTESALEGRRDLGSRREADGQRGEEWEQGEFDSYQWEVLAAKRGIMVAPADPWVYTTGCAVEGTRHRARDTARARREEPGVGQAYRSKAEGLEAEEDFQGYRAEVSAAKHGVMHPSASAGENSATGKQKEKSRLWPFQERKSSESDAQKQALGNGKNAVPYRNVSVPNTRYG